MEDFIENIDEAFERLANEGPRVNSVEALSLAAAVIHRMVQLKKTGSEDPLEVKALYLVLTELTTMALVRDKISTESLMDPDVMERADGLMNAID